MLLEQRGCLHVAEALGGAVLMRFVQYVLIVRLAAMWAVDVKHCLSPVLSRFVSGNSFFFGLQAVDKIHSFVSLARRRDYQALVVLQSLEP